MAWISGGTALLGVALMLPADTEIPMATAALARPPRAAVLQRFWFGGWGFDWLYDLFWFAPISFWRGSTGTISWTVSLASWHGWASWATGE